MSVLVPATRLIGLPVVTLNGDDLAEVKDLVYSPEAGRLLGLTLNKRGWLSGPLKQVLPWEGIAAVGRDAVMVPDADALVLRKDAPDEMGNLPKNRDVIGDPVITDEGTTLGEVVDLVLAVDGSARVVGYEVASVARSGREHSGRVLIPLPEQLAVSGDALVVPAAVEGFVRDDLTGFGAAVEDFRSQLGSGSRPDTQSRGTG